MLKDMDFYHFQENIEKKLLDTGLDSLKATFKKVGQKAGEILGNKIVDKEIIIPPKKREKILKQILRRIKTSIIKMTRYKVSKKFVTENGFK